MKLSKKVLTALIFGAFGAAAFTLISATNLKNTSLKQSGKIANTEAGIKWLTFEEALVLQEKEPRMWVIDFWTDWCGWCKRMEATTFSDPKIGAFVNENYYAVSFNAEQKEEITVKGRTYKFIENGRRGYHELAAELMQGKMSYPTVVFLNRDMQIFQALPGYRTKEDFHPIVQYFHQYDPLKPITFDDYMEKYESPYTINPE